MRKLFIVSLIGIILILSACKDKSGSDVSETTTQASITTEVTSTT